MNFTTPGGRAVARQTIRARMNELGWSDGRLADEAGIGSYNTVAEFLNGTREWPRKSTRLKLERALGWAAGAIERIAQGAAGPPAPGEGSSNVTDMRFGRSVDSVTDVTQGVTVMLGFPAEVLDGLDPADRAEAEAAAAAAYLRTLREIRAARTSP